MNGTVMDLQVTELLSAGVFLSAEETTAAASSIATRPNVPEQNVRTKNKTSWSLPETTDTTVFMMGQ